MIEKILPLIFCRGLTHLPYEISELKGAARRLDLDNNKSLGLLVTAKRYLFIDAYNVIHAIEDLRRVLNTDLDSACDRLAKRVAAIHDAETIHTILVFDSRNESLEVDHPLGKGVSSAEFRQHKIHKQYTYQQLSHSLKYR